MMQQPGNGVVPPPMVPNQQQQNYHQPPPQQNQPWMMMAPHQQQPQQPSYQPHPQQMWGQQPPPQQPLPQPVQPQQQPQQYQSAQTTGEVKSLWIGDLQPWMDEAYLYSCFAATGETPSVKVIRNKLTLQPEGYGFIEFSTRAAAERVLQTYNGAIMPNSEQPFRMNWATLAAGERRDNTPDFTIFVGDLAADVTDYLLQETFKVHYPSVKGAKVVTDRTTGRPKGYGFVRFADESEQVRAMTEMNGVLCSTRPMRVGPAATKSSAGGQQYQKASYQNSQASPGETDPNNTTIFVGGLDESVSDEHLRQVFGQYGDLVHVKIPPGKRCGFVQFAERASAEQALSMLNGTQLGGQSIRLSWGRSSSNRQSQQPDQNQYGAYGGAYGAYPQGYEAAYGYTHHPPQDPNMYYGAYPGYAGNYQQQQPQAPQQ